MEAPRRRACTSPLRMPADSNKVDRKAAGRLPGPRQGAKEAGAEGPKTSNAAAPALGAAAGGAYAECLPWEKGASALAGRGPAGRQRGSGERRKGVRRWAWPPVRSCSRSLEISTEPPSSWAAEALAASSRRGPT